MCFFSPKPVNKSLPFNPGVGADDSRDSGVGAGLGPWVTKGQELKSMDGIKAQQQQFIPVCQ